MDFIPVPGGVQVNINQLYGTEPVQNTLYFSSDTTIGIANCQILAQAVLDYWIANMVPNQSVAVQLFAVEAFSLEAQEGPYGQAVPLAPTFGGIGTENAPNNVSASCSFRTGLRGRSHRGRNYWVGIPKAFIAGNYIDVDYLSDVLGAYAGMMGASTLADDFRWCVCSRKHDGEWRSEGVLLPITSVLFVDNIVDSMRNRLPQHNS